MTTCVRIKILQAIAIGLWIGGGNIAMAKWVQQPTLPNEPVGSLEHCVRASDLDDSDSKPEVLPPEQSPQKSAAQENVDLNQINVSINILANSVKIQNEQIMSLMQGQSQLNTNLTQRVQALEAAAAAAAKAAPQAISNCPPSNVPAKCPLCHSASSWYCSGPIPSSGINFGVCETSSPPAWIGHYLPAPAAYLPVGRRVGLFCR